jgi:hypothetical protein
MQPIVTTTTSLLYKNALISGYIEKEICTYILICNIQLLLPPSSPPGFFTVSSTSATVSPVCTVRQSRPCDKYHTTLAASTLVIIFPETLKMLVKTNRKITKEIEGKILNLQK